MKRLCTVETPTSSYQNFETDKPWEGRKKFVLAQLRLWPSEDCAESDRTIDQCMIHMKRPRLPCNDRQSNHDRRCLLRYHTWSVVLQGTSKLNCKAKNCKHKHELKPQTWSRVQRLSGIRRLSLKGQADNWDYITGEGDIKSKSVSCEKRPKIILYAFIYLFC